jgi:hypothetical protein
LPAACAASPREAPTRLQACNLQAACPRTQSLRLLQLRARTAPARAALGVPAAAATAADPASSAVGTGQQDRSCRNGTVGRRQLIPLLPQIRSATRDAS